MVIVEHVKSNLMLTEENKVGRKGRGLKQHRQ